MLSSISPVGEAARRQRWGVTVAAYFVGSTAAAAALGGLLGGTAELLGIGRVPGRLAWAVLAVTAVVALVLDLAGRTPGPLRQVDEAWLTAYRGWVYGLGYGLQLGTGVATIVPSSLVWLTWLTALLTGDAAHGALVGVAFGAARAVPVMLGRGAASPPRLRHLLARVDALRRPVSLAAYGALVLVAAAAGLAATI